MRRSKESRYASPLPSSLTPEQAALYREIIAGERAGGTFPLKDDEGRLLGPFGPMLSIPRIGDPLQELGAAIRYRGSLGDREREIAILAVATQAGSMFELWAHERVAIAVGISDSEVIDLREGRFRGADLRERQIYVLATCLYADRPITDEMYDDVLTSLGEPTLAELVVLVGYYRTLASLLRLFQIQAPEDE